MLIQFSEAIQESGVWTYVGWSTEAMQRYSKSCTGTSQGKVGLTMSILDPEAEEFPDASRRVFSWWTERNTVRNFNFKLGTPVPVYPPWQKNEKLRFGDLVPEKSSSGVRKLRASRSETVKTHEAEFGFLSEFPVSTEQHSHEAWNLGPSNWHAAPAIPENRGIQKMEIQFFS